jgi:hypothetical protein
VPKTAPRNENEQAVSIVGVIYARKLKELARDAEFGSGFGARTMSRIGGTDAYSVSNTATQLRRMVADARAVDFWIDEQGRIALPSKSAQTCGLLADSISNLDIGQSDDQFHENIVITEAYFKRRFERFGGTDLERKIAELDKY